MYQPIVNYGSGLIETMMKFLHSPSLKSIASYLIRQLLNIWGM